MPTTCVEAREYRRNLQTDFSTILQPTFQACVAMAKKIKNLALYFFSTKPIPRIHGAQTYIGSHMVRSQTRSRVRRIDQWLLEWQYKSKMGILKQNKFTCWKKLWTKTLPEFGKVKPAQLNFGFVQCMGAAHGTCKIWAPGTQLIKTSPAQTNSSQSWKKNSSDSLGRSFQIPCMHAWVSPFPPVD